MKPRGPRGQVNTDGPRKDQRREPGDPLAHPRTRHGYTGQKPERTRTQTSVGLRTGLPMPHPSTRRGPVPCWHPARQDSQSESRPAKIGRKATKTQTKSRREPLTHKCHSSEKNPVGEKGKARKQAQKSEISSEIEIQWSPTRPNHPGRDGPMGCQVPRPPCLHVTLVAGIQGTVPWARRDPGLAGTPEVVRTRDLGRIWIISRTYPKISTPI